MALQVPVLAGTRVRLEPLTGDHADGLVAAAEENRDTYAFTTVPRGRSGVDAYLRAIFAGETMDMSWRAHMFELPDGWSAEDAIAFYRAETAAADKVLDAAPSFDLPSRGSFRPTTLRWAVTHVIEETARHCGHMDITRELLDGLTGR